MARPKHRVEVPETPFFPVEDSAPHKPAALFLLLPDLHAMAERDVRRIHLDLGHCARVGAALWAYVQRPSVAERLKCLPQEQFEMQWVEDLANQVEALRYVKGRVQAADRAANHRAAPEDLLFEARALRNRVLMAAQYGLPSSLLAEFRLSRLSVGAGPVFLASDLLRLIDLVTPYQTRLSQTTPLFRYEDLERAPELAAEILAAIGPEESLKWRRLAARVFTLFCTTYERIHWALMDVSPETDGASPFLELPAMVRAWAPRRKRVNVSAVND